jgi:hypothetical protein
VVVIVVLSVCAVADVGFLGHYANLTDRPCHDNEANANILLSGCDNGLAFK